MTATSWLEYQWAFTTAAWALVAGAAMVLWIALFKDRSRGRKRCPRCWYDMTGVPELKCPECGHEVRRESRLFTTRRRWRLACVGLLLALLGVCSSYTPRTLEDGIAAAVPIPVLNLVLAFWSKEAQKLYTTQVVEPLQAGRATTLSPLTSFEKLLIASHVQLAAPSRLRGLPRAFISQGWPKAECALLETLGAELRPALPVLIELTRDIDPTVRRASVDLIGACAVGGSDEAARALKTLYFNSGDADVKIRAIEVLATGVYTVPRLRPVLLDAVMDGLSPQYSAAGAFALGASATNAAKDVQEVKTLLQSKHAPVRLRCLQGLLQSATPPINLSDTCCLLLTNDPSSEVRWTAAHAARKLFNGESSWVQAVEHGLYDEDPQVRTECVSVLIGLMRRTPEAIAAARRLVQREPPHSHRGLFVVHIATIEGAAFLRSIADHDASPAVRAVAVRALFQHRAEAGIDPQYFGALLSDPAPEVIHAAADCLGRLGMEARPHLDALRKVREHPNAPVRAAVESAIARIESDPE